jgi:predicted kinase
MAVLVLMGLANSGKTTFAQALRQRVPCIYISPDEALYDEQQYRWTRERSADAWRLAYRRYGEALANLRDVPKDVAVVFDAMFLTAISRCATVNVAKGQKQRVVGLFFDTPLNTCVQRNLQRTHDRRLPDGKLEALAMQIEPPTRAEGFDQILIVTPENFDKVLEEAA